jgi:hypothetical protein
MMGLFCASKAKNNEEYKKVIKARMNTMVLIFVIGLITLTVSLLAEKVWTVKISEHMLGVYCGGGTGLLAISIILWIKNKVILGNEAKLKESRLNNTDERLKEISNRAFRIATIFLLIALYVVGLIGGLFYPILVQVLSILVFVFLAAYVVTYKIYEKRM